jgi:tRNA (cytidine/uridine-2'-O-)-methyltransferase
MRLALYQPDIPQNTGTILRLGACMGVAVDIIEPCGYAFSDKKFRRAGMDYLEQAEYKRHQSWEFFLEWQKSNNRRLVLLSTKAELNYTDFCFRPEDTLLLGRESAGVPQSVADIVDKKITIKMRPEARSLNVAVAASMVLGEALRQIKKIEG